MSKDRDARQQERREALYRALTVEETNLLVDLAYDVFERDADNPLGGNFRIHPTVRAQYKAEIKALYEKHRRGDVVR
jgi:hypothetical protein